MKAAGACGHLGCGPECRQPWIETRPTGSMVAMTHESHGFCFCGLIHCGGGIDCPGLDGCDDSVWPSPGLGRLSQGHDTTKEK